MKIELVERHTTVINAVAVHVRRGRCSSEVLAVRRKEAPEILCMPGGKVEIGELPRAAACRETLEETGLDLRPNDLHWVGAIEIERRTSGLEMVAVFTATAPAGYEPSADIGEPGLDPQWIGIDDLCDPAQGRFAGPASLARMVHR